MGPVGITSKEASMLAPDFDRDQFIADLRSKHARILPADIVFNVENGWLPLVSEGLAEIEAALDVHGSVQTATIQQIKEKFGELRIYVEPSREGHQFSKELAAELAEIRIRSRNASMVTCEICGDAGEIDSFDGYYQCLCLTHAGQRRAWICRGRIGDIFHD